MIFEGLNDSQKQAVTTTESPVLVVAGPGTGKTLTIIRRIAYLIDQGINPENILAVTFTNRAARQMKERAESLFGTQARGLFIGTLHLLGIKILREIGMNGFVLLGRDEQVEALKPICKESGVKAREAVEKISRIKNLVCEIDDGIKDIYETYQGRLQKDSILDFDDLILKPVDIFDKNLEILQKYRGIFKYIIVDEYQDINPAQNRLLSLIAGDSGNICVVGDADQAIYAFRGANIDNFLNFPKDYAGSRTITLATNYRSTDAIVNASSALIKSNQRRIDRDLNSARERGLPITVVSIPDERAEGEWIVGEIQALMGGTCMNTAKADVRKSYSFSDFAVIYRTNAQAKAIEDAFLLSGIPYQVIGRKNLRQKKEIEDTISYMKSILNSPEDTDAPEDASPEERLLTPNDFFDPRADAVTLMTMHMAKGLEFKVVFIAGVEEGLMPYTINKDDVDLEEERRLFYVGMTRAKDELFLVHARNRFLYGQRLEQSPSPFLKEIPERLMKNITIPDRAKKAKKEKQAGLF
ncbi:MAG: UvrD-helicase domain-containing protein [Nitrospirae bacterium]|nr:UvrD-helicase domain-containing protein [Nitrospirota bacterium]